MRDTYDAVYARWLNDPENFWAEAAAAVHWDRKWDRVLDDSRPPFYRWFPGGLLNLAITLSIATSKAAGRISRRSFTTVLSRESFRRSPIASCWIK